jgi:hypothetical protein
MSPVFKALEQQLFWLAVSPVFKALECMLVKLLMEQIDL